MRTLLIALCLHSVLACTDTDGSAVDPYGDGCEYYDSNPAACGNYDDSDFYSNQMCCSCGGGDDGGGDDGGGDDCSDTNGSAIDSYGDDCDWYDSNPTGCGDYDDSDFSSNAMCCGCGGGDDGAPTSAVTSAPMPAVTSAPMRAPTFAPTTGVDPSCESFDSARMKYVCASSDGSGTHGWSGNGRTLLGISMSGNACLAACEALGLDGCCESRGFGNNYASGGGCNFKEDAYMSYSSAHDTTKSVWCESGRCCAVTTPNPTPAPTVTPLPTAPRPACSCCQNCWVTEKYKDGCNFWGDCTWTCEAETDFTCGSGILTCDGAGNDSDQGLYWGLGVPGIIGLIIFAGWVKKEPRFKAWKEAGDTCMHRAKATAKIVGGLNGLVTKSLAIDETGKVRLARAVERHTSPPVRPSLAHRRTAVSCNFAWRMTSARLTTAAPSSRTSRIRASSPSPSHSSQ